MKGVGRESRAGREMATQPSPEVGTCRAHLALQTVARTVTKGEDPVSFI